MHYFIAIVFLSSPILFHILSAVIWDESSGIWFDDKCLPVSQFIAAIITADSLISELTFRSLFIMEKNSQNCSPAIARSISATGTAVSCGAHLQGNWLYGRKLRRRQRRQQQRRFVTHKRTLGVTAKTFPKTEKFLLISQLWFVRKIN